MFDFVCVCVCVCERGVSTQAELNDIKPDISKPSPIASQEQFIQWAGRSYRRYPILHPDVTGALLSLNYVVPDPFDIKPLSAVGRRVVGEGVKYQGQGMIHMYMIMIS